MLALVLGVLSPGTEPGCRCVPPDKCWGDVPWHSLNASVEGRLAVSVDELAPCITSLGGDVNSATCAGVLAKTDDEFWISDQPNGYMHTGLFNEWSTADRVSAYSVLARTEQDFQAAVKFAADHNLRLVVKNTGHDWYGRSAAAGSLLLWTHQRKQITWHDDGFVAAGCAAGDHPTAPVSAVTVESGVQFQDLYPRAIERGKIVMGGTCDSVGVAGCWTAGCYGPFTKKFGNGALNILEARVVLANGTLVTTSKCSHPDLFMAIRGGGGGVAGVVTEFTAASHRTPNHLSDAGFSGSASSKAECTALIAKTLQASSVLATPGYAGELCDNGGTNWNWNGHNCTMSWSCNAYEGDPVAMQAKLRPLADWANAQNGTMRGSVSGAVSWNASYYRPDDPICTKPWSIEQPNSHCKLPWMEHHADSEISTALLASMSKFFPAHYMATDAGSRALAEALIEIQELLPTETLPGDWMMGAKGQAGLPAELAAELHTTSLNPVLLDATGTYLIMYNIPSLPIGAGVKPAAPDAAAAAPDLRAPGPLRPAPGRLQGRRRRQRERRGGLHGAVARPDPGAAGQAREGPPAAVEGAAERGPRGQSAVGLVLV